MARRCLASQGQRDGFALDSPLEGTGFELLVPSRGSELSVPLARDDTGVRNSLALAAWVQLRYHFPTRPVIVNEGAGDRDTGGMPENRARPRRSLERVGDRLEDRQVGPAPADAGEQAPHPTPIAVLRVPRRICSRMRFAA